VIDGGTDPHPLLAGWAGWLICWLAAWLDCQTWLGCALVFGVGSVFHFAYVVGGLLLCGTDTQAY